MLHQSPNKQNKDSATKMMQHSM